MSFCYEMGYRQFMQCSLLVSLFQMMQILETMNSIVNRELNLHCQSFKVGKGSCYLNHPNID